MTNAIITVGGVHGYVDENNVAWINAADIARGLGFTQTQNKDGKIYTSIRWATINAYLKEFGFPQQVGEKDFIPENMFYRLAMKAKNETAEKFQAKVADDILPTIRKTGSYSVAPKTTPELYGVHKLVKDVGETSIFLQNYFGVAKGIALATATDIVSEMNEVNLTSLKKLIPPAAHEIGTLTPTDIGNELGISARKVNEKLVEKGYQVKESRDYRLTDEGRKFAEAMPYTRNGHSCYQIKWIPEITTILLEHSAQ